MSIYIHDNNLCTFFNVFLFSLDTATTCYGDNVKICKSVITHFHNILKKDGDKMYVTFITKDTVLTCF